MRVVLTFLSMIAVAPAWPQSDDLTYKGVPLGASVAEYKAKLPDQSCHKKGDLEWCFYEYEQCTYSKERGKTYMRLPVNDIMACRARNSFGGLSTINAQAEFPDGKLSFIRFTIESSSFESLAAAATEKLGNPTSVINSTVQTRSGAKFENSQMTWVRTSMVFTATKYSETIDKGYAVLTTPQEHKRKLEELETRTKKGAKDF